MRIAMVDITQVERRLRVLPHLHGFVNRGCLPQRGDAIAKCKGS